MLAHACPHGAGPLSTAKARSAYFHSFSVSLFSIFLSICLIRKMVRCEQVWSGLSLACICRFTGHIPLPSAWGRELGFYFRHVPIFRSLNMRRGGNATEFPLHSFRIPHCCLMQRAACRGNTTTVWPTGGRAVNGVVIFRTQSLPAISPLLKC